MKRQFRDLKVLLISPIILCRKKNMQCKKCNNQVSVLDDKCPQCGHDLTKVDIDTKYAETSNPSWIKGVERKWTGEGSFKEAGVKDVDVEVRHWDKLNWSLINYGIPLINNLTITNISGSNIENIIVRIRLAPDYGDSWEHSVASIPSNKTFISENINIPLSKERLFTAKEAERASLKTEISSNGNEVFLKTTPIEVLAFNEWFFHPLISESLAGFILPNCNAVKETIKHAGDHLKELKVSASFDGYQSNDRSKVEAMSHALYLALQKGLKIKYINPPSSFEETGQKILFPDEILNISRGTCLDLAIFYAACIERIGLYPLVFLVPGHALLGIWLSSEDHIDFWKKEAELEEDFKKRPVSDAKQAAEGYYKHLLERYERFKEAIDNGLIMPLNSTTFTSDSDFDKCKRDGTEICKKAPFEAVIDVTIARSKVKPMPV